MGKQVIRQKLARHGGVPATRVSTLELFFDLVFVFAVTQLTRTLLEPEPGPLALGRAAVLLAALLWVYGSYAWLTNAAQPRSTALRLTLLVGMACFLVMALAVPHVFTGSTGNRLGFGLAFVAATVVHGVAFLVVGDERTRRRMALLLPRNVVIALVATLACALSGTASTVAWLVFLAVLVGAGVRNDDSQFRIQAEHFAERMGLLVIIVLGESVVAVGAGASALPYGGALVVDAVVGLALVSALWWCWFAVDDEEITAALAAVEVERRSRVALLALGYPFLLVLGGVVLVAAGLQRATGHPFAPLDAQVAAYLSGGVAVYLAGTAVVRVVLGLPVGRLRLVAAAVALLATPAALVVPAQVFVALLAVIVVAHLAVEDATRTAQEPAPHEPGAQEPATSPSRISDPDPSISRTALG